MSPDVECEDVKINVMHVLPQEISSPKDRSRKYPIRRNKYSNLKTEFVPSKFIRART